MKSDYSFEFNLEVRIARRLAKSKARDWKQQHRDRLFEMHHDGLISAAEYAKNIGVK